MPINGPTDDWAPQGAGPIGFLGAHPFVEDLWYSKTNQRLYRWSLKFVEDVMDNVVTAVLKVWIRKRVYFNYHGTLWSRGFSNQDLEGSPPKDVVYPFIDRSEPPGQIGRNSQQLFVDTVILLQMQEGIGVGQDASNPIPYVILEDGRVDESFCFDSKDNCGVPLDKITRLKPVPYEPPVQIMTTQTPFTTPPPAIGSSDSTASGIIGMSSSLSISTSVIQNSSVVIPITTQAVVRGSDGIATKILLNITPTDPNLSQSTNADKPNSQLAPSNSTNNILIGVGIPGGRSLPVALVVGLVMFRRLQKKAPASPDLETTTTVRKKLTLFKQPQQSRQRSFYKISRANEMFESPLRTSSVGVVPQIITAMPPLPRPSDVSSAPATALSRDESVGSMTPLQRSNSLDESTIVRNRPNEKVDTVVAHPDSVMFDTPK
ncbi:hypothetical protein HDU97_004511 [Phlyctochytrium planicorne]|nr:hypothetical protein HDU97_004511 [Phlyctochytrium planicorne]